jgi:molecular chaperone DnaJ
MHDADPHLILGVSPGAGAGDIKRAFRSKARQLHPDHNHGDPAAEEQFKRVSWAYETLLANCDKDDFTPATVPSPSPSTVPVCGDDVHTDVTLGLSQARQGCEVTIAMRAYAVCNACGGERWDRLGRPCAACLGNGAGPQTVDVDLLVPAGAHDRQIFTFEGCGLPGNADGTSGDLHLTVNLRADPPFTREGDTLLVDVPVTVEEAINGAVIDVPTADGVRHVRLAAGTQSGSRQRIPGGGLPLADGPGDLIMTITVLIPAARTEEHRAAVRKLGDDLRLLSSREHLWNDASPPA